MDFNNWIRQPTTIHGLGVLAAGLGAGMSQLVTGNPTVDGVVAVIAYVLMHLGIDDHSVTEKVITSMTAEIGQSLAPLLAPTAVIPPTPVATIATTGTVPAAPVVPAASAPVPVKEATP